jgi:hypothetical protein
VGAEQLNTQYRFAERRSVNLAETVFMKNE